MVLLLTQHEQVHASTAAHTHLENFWQRLASDR